MAKIDFKKQFAKATAQAFQTVYPDIFKKQGEEQVFDNEFIYENLEKPKDPQLGRFAFPVFRYAKLLNDNPNEIAAKIAHKNNQLIKNTSESVPFEAVATGGFINAKINAEIEAQQTLEEILTKSSEYGSSKKGKGHKILVEYSSPNIAKPFGIGHLRTTILGNSLRRIFRKLGYEAIGINYLGDWGTQFGKMIVAYKKWGKKNKNTVADLYDLYVKIHREAEQDNKLNDEARAAFKKLEDGDKEITALWEYFKTISWAEFERIYNLMDIEFDWVTGESFLNDKMEQVIDRLKEAKLTSISEGALIVELDDPQLPPCLLKKADGATLYATRDLAGLLYRWDKYKFDEALYVVGSAQAVHFKQVFKVIDLLEKAENIPENNRIDGRAKHIDFGWVKFGDKMMSTRQGNIIFLEDVINKAVALAKEKIKEKNPDLKNIEETALTIGVGAVIFSQLSVRRQKDVNFDWNEVLNFEGETGPYLQYTHARLCSLIRNYHEEIVSDINYSLLHNEEEKRIIEHLSDFPELVHEAAKNYEPNFIATYLLKLSGAFNKFYQRKKEDGKIDKIISDDKELTSARMALVKAVQIILKEGLYLLGIKAPEEM
ncbi:MAG: arginine--tRNA ligase [FCB group bacterium]|nr:arginine--tRNA ligase [FCB group bacterium]